MRVTLNGLDGQNVDIEELWLVSGVAGKDLCGFHAFECRTCSSLFLFNRVLCMTIFQELLLGCFLRFPLRAAFFTADMRRVISVSRDGAFFLWKWWDAWELEHHEGEELVERGLHLSHRRPNAKKEDVKEEEEESSRKRRKIDEGAAERPATVSYVDGKWTLEKKVFCSTGSLGRITKCCYHLHSGVLAVGFNNGTISLYESPSFDALYTLSIGSVSILDSISINRSGDWLAFGSANLGQVRVALLTKRSIEWGC